MISWQKQLLSDLRRHEGCRLEAYQDTVGVWTIGYGHTGRDVKPGVRISQSEAERLLTIDTAIAIEGARAVVQLFDLQSDVRKTVLVNMCFNLGKVGLSKFKATLSAIKEGEYPEAAYRMANSLWYKQVKGRARELVLRMLTNTIQDEHVYKEKP